MLTTGTVALEEDCETNTGRMEGFRQSIGVTN